ncbi:MAG: hypothetical protein H0W73_13080 [Bacteroidetes bacterium]|nr:hypothetical protein [Bacteroidota bacterium]
MNKLKLFEHTYNKLVLDKAFMAYYLDQLILRENKTKEEVFVLLNCLPEDFYKLALCKAPEINAIDFKQRILKIAEYSNTSALILTNIIQLSSQTVKAENKQPSVLKKISNDIKELFPLPTWLVKARPAIYNTFVTACSIILIIAIFTPQKQETKNVQLFMTDYFGYTDSIKYIQVQDNTGQP